MEKREFSSSLHAKDREEAVGHVNQALGRITRNWVLQACSVLAMYASS